jgi:hypothetical protein
MNDEPPQWLQDILHSQNMQIQNLATQNANTIATMADRLNAYEERLHAAPSRVSNPIASPLQPPSTTQDDLVVRRPRPRLPDPEQFNGKNPALYPQFAGILRAKLEIDGRTIGGEKEQVWYAFGRLSGEAAGRIYPWMTHAQRTNTHTLDRFFEQMQLAFSDPRSRQKAMAQLNRTKQRSCPLSEFLNEFNRLILEAEGWNWDEVVKKGYLKAAISLKLLQATVGLREEESYEGYCSQLRMVDDQLAEVQDMTNRRTTRQGERAASVQAEVPSEAMDWEPSVSTAATRTTRKEPRWASPEEINRRRKEELCLRCGEEGHFVRQCRTKLRTPKKKKITVAAVERKKDDSSDSNNGDSENE